MTLTFPFARRSLLAARRLLATCGPVFTVWRRVLACVFARAQGLHSTETVAEVLGCLSKATVCAPNWSKAWHQWALFNVAVMLVSTAAPPLPPPSPSRLCSTARPPTPSRLRSTARPPTPSR